MNPDENLGVLEAARAIARRELDRMILLGESCAISAAAMRHSLGFNGLAGGLPLATLRKDLAAEPAVQSILDELWPVLTPRQVFADLFASPAAPASAAPGLTEAERLSLVRDPAGGWAPSDVPLLDELAELLGEDDREARARAERLHRARLEYAQGVLDIAAGSSWLMTVWTAWTELISSPCTPLTRTTRLPGLAPRATVTDTCQCCPVGIATPRKYRRCFRPGSRSFTSSTVTTRFPSITSPV